MLSALAVHDHVLLIVVLLLSLVLLGNETNQRLTGRFESSVLMLDGAADPALVHNLLHLRRLHGALLLDTQGLLFHNRGAHQVLIMTDGCWMCFVVRLQLVDEARQVDGWLLSTDHGCMLLLDLSRSLEMLL